MYYSLLNKLLNLFFCSGLMPPQEELEALGNFDQGTREASVPHDGAEDMMLASSNFAQGTEGIHEPCGRHEHMMLAASDFGQGTREASVPRDEANLPRDGPEEPVDIGASLAFLHIYAWLSVRFGITLVLRSVFPV